MPSSPPYREGVDRAAVARRSEFGQCLSRLAAVVIQAEELFRKFETVPRPDGFRIVENGVVVYEFAESPDT